MFSLSHLLTASSLWISAKISNRIGLLNTMVFTHIPSSFFLLAAAFAPSATLAIVFWQCRAFLSQMDVPTRDSYTMAVINPEERVAMVSINMVSRSAAGAIGPTVTTAIWNVTAAWTPLVGSALLKIGYDLSLYFMFRKVRPPEEEERLRNRGQARQGAGHDQGRQKSVDYSGQDNFQLAYLPHGGRTADTMIRRGGAVGLCQTVDSGSPPPGLPIRPAGPRSR